MPLVFQYGSNCTAARLNGPTRLNGNAKDLGRAQTIEEYDIAFNVPSQTNGCAAADLVDAGGSGHGVWGVLYEIPEDIIRGKRDDGQKTLEQIEGPRYEEKTIRVRNEAGEEVEATTFVVIKNHRDPTLWTSVAYVSFIIYGLRAHGVPEEYIAHVANTAIRTNEQSVETASEQTRLIRNL